MPTELEELVEFLHHGNTQIRQIAVKNLVPYSRTQPSLFKHKGLEPVRDLRLLVKDYAPIKRNALTILVNISGDRDVVKVLADDDAFLESLLRRITNAKEPDADAIAMLLANMAKSDGMQRLLKLERDEAPGLPGSKAAVDQLMDCFVRGAQGSWNPEADFDHLAYLFADLAKFPAGSAYLATARAYDGVHPLAKLLPFTTSGSAVRRLGVASALKNVAFNLHARPALLLSPPLAVLPYVLLPLASGADRYSEAEAEAMLEDLQLLDDGVRREPDARVLTALLETLLLLASGGRWGRDVLRGAGAYYVVRECHLAVDHEELRERCERLVQMLMRDEGEEEEEEEEEHDDDDDDDDSKVVEIV